MRRAAAKYCLSQLRSRMKAQRMVSRNRWKHLIGLTGGFGSGKSMVLKIFKNLRVAVLDADTIVHELLKKDRSVNKKIARLFGQEALRHGAPRAKPVVPVFAAGEGRQRNSGDISPKPSFAFSHGQSPWYPAKADGTVNRKKLAELIFQSKPARQKLERLIHPLVLRKMQRKLAASKGHLAVVDVPLLFEKKWDKYFDQTIVVRAYRARRMERLLKMGLSKKEIRRRMAAQGSLIAKVKKADFVIDNNGTIQETKKQVKTIIDLIHSRRTYGIKSRR